MKTLKRCIKFFSFFSPFPYLFIYSINIQKLQLRKSKVSKMLIKMEKSDTFFQGSLLRGLNTPPLDRPGAGGIALLNLFNGSDP